MATLLRGAGLADDRRRLARGYGQAQVAHRLDWTDVDGETVQREQRLAHSLWLAARKIASPS